MPEHHLRAADADREAVARRLGEHMSAGRLTLAEYEERLSDAWAAKTYGDLAELTADLPATPPPRTTPSTGVAAPRAHATGGCGGAPWAWGGHRAWSASSARAAWTGWLTTALIVVTIWLATSLGGGGWQGFWPIWVIGPWGAALLARTLTGSPRRPDGPRLDA
jgi:hypothetical protein